MWKLFVHEDPDDPSVWVEGCEPSDNCREIEAAFREAARNGDKVAQAAVRLTGDRIWLAFRGARNYPSVRLYVDGNAR